MLSTLSFYDCFSLLPWVISFALYFLNLPQNFNVHMKSEDFIYCCLQEFCVIPSYLLVLFYFFFLCFFNLCRFFTFCHSFLGLPFGCTHSVLVCVFMLAFYIVFAQLFQSAATLLFRISLDFLHPPFY